MQKIKIPEIQQKIHKKWLFSFLNGIFRVSFLIIIIITGFVFQSCEKDPNDLGFNYVPPDDTLGTLILESQTDTMAITYDNYRKYINTYLAPYNLVGKYQEYDSKFFLKFTALSPDYDSCTVLSSELYLSYNDYFFQDSLGTVSFNVFPLTDTLTFSTVNLDNLPSSIIGTSSAGNYTGVPVDSARIGFSIDTGLVRQWLWKAANSNYSFNNYGIAFVPTLSSTSIKGFYSGLYVADSLKPTLRAIVQSGSDIDTLTFSGSESITFNDASLNILMNERIVINSGVSFRNILNFDLTKLPPNVTINEAYIEMTLDASSSYIKNSNENRLAFSMIIDTSLKASDGFFYYSSKKDTNIFYVRVQPIFQKWNLGISPKYGIIITHIFENTSLDRYVFYSPDASDISKRPKLRIRYTPRN